MESKTETGLLWTLHWVGSRPTEENTLGQPRRLPNGGRFDRREGQRQGTLLGHRDPVGTTRKKPKVLGPILRLAGEMDQWPSETSLV